MMRTRRNINHIAPTIPQGVRRAPGAPTHTHNEWRGEKKEEETELRRNFKPSEEAKEQRQRKKEKKIKLKKLKKNDSNHNHNNKNYNYNYY